MFEFQQYYYHKKNEMGRPHDAHREMKNSKFLLDRLKGRHYVGD
jgi:hypothetical protein